MCAPLLNLMLCLTLFPYTPSSASAVSHCISPCSDYITLSVCCVHLDLKLITSDNLVVLFPKFKSFSGERVIESCRGRRGERWSESSMLEVLTICRVQYINCLSVFDFRVIWSQSDASFSQLLFFGVC